MKCIILAGGKGSRLSELTKSIPKPMVKITDKPIIFHIMNHYSKFGISDFIVAAGYKKNIIKNYFKKKIKDWNVKIVDTGLNTMTGGRLKRLSKYLKKETFLMTYGDGLSNVNLKKLVKFHKQKKKLMTLTAVRPPARFGAIKIINNTVRYFKEKSSLDEGWINGGFFVIEPEFLDFIDGDDTLLEREPLEIAAKAGELMAFRHNGFWQCMDSKRDKDYLDKLSINNPPWKKSF